MDSKKVSVKSVRNGKDTGKIGKNKPPAEHQFTSENQPKNRRKKAVKTVLREFRHDVSDEVVERIAGTMLAALACKSTRDAQARLKEAEENEPEYGWIFEQTILAVKKDGLKAIIEVMEWIFGKKTNLNVKGDLGVEVKPLVDLTKRRKNGDDEGKQ